MREINRIETGDLPALAELYAELSDEPVDQEGMRAAYERIREHPDYALFAVRVDGQLAGSAMAVVCWQLNRDAWPFMVMENFIIGGGYRRLGLGRELLRAVEALAVDRGCRSVMFASSMRRSGAHRFYEAAGYALDEVRGFRKILPPRG